MRKAKYYDYTVTEDGTVYGKNNKILTPYNNRYVIFIDGRQTSISVPRIIFKAFHHPCECGIYDIIKTKVKGDYHLDNLYVHNSVGFKKYQFSKMRSKDEIINRLNSYLGIAGLPDVGKELLWVLGMDV